MSKVLLLLVLIITSLPLCAEDNKVNNNSMLWKVTGPGLSQPSYVFGTWHMLCRNEVVFKHKVKVAISQTEQLLMQNYISYLSSEDFFDRIKTDERVYQDLPIYQIDDRKKRKRLSKLISQKLDLKPDHAKRISYAVKRMTPMQVFFASMHSFIKNCDGLGSFENMLFDHFEKQSQGIGSFNQREDFYRSLLASGFLQVDSLIDYLEGIESQQAIVHNMKLHYYVDEDLAGLKELYRIFLNNDHTDVKSIDNHIFNINTQPWVTKMVQWMMVKPTFITVNANYLLGDQGVLKTLADLGYHTEPIF